MTSSPSDVRAGRLARLGVLAMAASDALVILASTIAAYWVRFEGAVSVEFLPTTRWLALSAIVVYVLLLWRFQLYRSLWRYAGVGVLLRLAAAVSIGTAVLFVADLLIEHPSPLDPDTSRLWPLSVVFALGVFTFVGTAAIRLLPRTLLYVQGMGRGRNLRSTLIIGAGDAGSLLLTDIEQRPELGIKVAGFLDDDRSKWRRDIRGVRILGPVSKLGDVIEREGIEEVFVALPAASQEERRRVLDLCVEQGVTTRVMNPLADLSTHVGVEDLRKVSIEDLLGRESIDIDIEPIEETIRGKVVAVTGAAGSIGAELCRQVADLAPARLVMIDVDESRLYDLDQELLRRGAENVDIHICDNRDLRKTTQVLVSEKPDLLFHAAAYKHVPLMETLAGRGREDERARHAQRPSRVHRSRREALRAHLDRQGGPPDHRHGQDEGDRRAAHARGRPRGPHPSERRAIWQRAGQPGKRGPAVRGAASCGRTGHRHAS